MVIRKTCRPIILAADDAYAMPLATTLRSVVEANPHDWPLEFHILSDRISPEHKEKVSKSLPKGSASINWRSASLEPFRNFSTIPHISKVTYARFLIPALFPDAVRKVLYLDSDILVLDELGPLWETELDGAVIGAVLDGLDRKIKEDHPETADLPRVRQYFNAGVLLIDVGRWRTERISEKALGYLARFPRSPYSDQDALNAACDGLWKPLDPRWNYQVPLEMRISDLDVNTRPAIAHFIWKFKPWDARFPNLNASFYDGFRNRTCFARTIPEKLSDKARAAWFHLKRFLRTVPGFSLFFHCAKNLKEGK